MNHASRITHHHLSLVTTAFGVVVLDLATKAFWFGREDMWTGLAPLLQTVHHRNYGLLFDIPAPVWLTVGVSCVVLLGAWLFLWRRLGEPWIAYGLGLIVGGAFGNMYDRVALGFVRDWILAFGRSAFNLADVAVVIGLIVLTKTFDRLR